MMHFWFEVVLTLLRSERPKLYTIFGISECNRVKEWANMSFGLRIFSWLGGFTFWFRIIFKDKQLCSSI